MTTASPDTITEHDTVVTVAADTRYDSGLRTARVVLQVATRSAIELVDLTDAIAKVVADTGLHTGWVDIACRHTSCGLLVNENETGLRKDMRTLCGELIEAHPDRLWSHDDLSVRTENLVDGERPNAHSHLLTMLLAEPSMTMWVEGGRLDLGRWQRIMLAEFDGPRPDPDLSDGQQPIHPIRQVVLNLCDLNRATLARRSRFSRASARTPWQGWPMVPRAEQVMFRTRRSSTRIRSNLRRSVSRALSWAMATMTLRRR